MPQVGAHLGPPLHVQVAPDVGHRRLVRLPHGVQHQEVGLAGHLVQVQPVHVVKW